MTRRPFETCADCGTVKWPVRGLGRVCPRCDHLHAWPVIMASYRPGPWQIEQGKAVHPAGHPDTELQRDVDSFLRGGPYDWQNDEGYNAL